MLTEARIEIVDLTGHVEDRVSIIGKGEVGLSTKGRCEFQAMSPGRPDVNPDVVIVLRDGDVYVQVKAAGTLQVNGKDLAIAERTNVRDEWVASIGIVERRLHVRTVVLATASLLSAAGAVIQSKPSQLEAWSARAATRGGRKVSEHLARLRAKGSIDENGNLLVAVPEDMKPDSPTDV